MVLSKIHYITVRIIRRFLFSTRFLERFGSFVPGYRVNCNQVDPGAVVLEYKKYAERNRLSLQGSVVLEIGVGATSSTAYGLAGLGCATVHAYEPFARFNARADAKFRKEAAAAAGPDGEAVVSRVRRTGDLAQVPPGTVDAVFSHSVLEHLREPAALFRDMSGILTDGGIMIHIVDYRDHFFRYPYHFLLFSKRNWRKWLDPGDLPGWRPGDHVSMLEEAGFAAAVDGVERDLDHWRRIRDSVSGDYDLNDPFLNVTHAVLVARKARP